jgi:hypothetical protein
MYVSPLEDELCGLEFYHPNYSHFSLEANLHRQGFAKIACESCYIPLWEELCVVSVS